MHAILDQYYVKTHKSQLHVDQVNYPFVGSSVGRFWSTVAGKKIPSWIDRKKMFRLLSLKWVHLLPETLRKHDEAGKRGTAFFTESRGIAFFASTAHDSAPKCDTLVA